MAAAPEVPGQPVIGSLLDVRKDRLAFVTSALRVGEVARFRMGRRWLHLVNDQTLARHVLVDRADNYRKGIGLEEARPILGDGLLTSEGATWRRQRDSIEPVMRSTRMDDYVPVMEGAAAEMLERWSATSRSGGTIDVDAEMRRLTLDILIRSLFRRAPERTDALGRALTLVLDDSVRRMLSPFPAIGRLPRRRSLRVRRALRSIDAQVRALGTTPRTPSPAEIVSLLVAGHETTAVALSWTLYLIGVHPDTERELRSGAPQRRAKLRRTIRESLRLYPPVWLIPRRAVSGDRLGPYRIPGGAEVLVSPFALQRDPRVWSEADRFRPDRFNADDGSRASVFLPFGLGPRRCVGTSFALTEMEVALTSILDRVRLRPAFAGVPTPNPMLTLRPPEPFEFRLSPA